MSRPKFLEEATVEELKARIEEIEKEVPPKALSDPNFEKLKAECQIYIDTLANGKKPDEDSAHYISEAALTAFFGKDVFKWINKKLKS
jgi:hypothetical protein